MKEKEISNTMKEISKVERFKISTLAQIHRFDQKTEEYLQKIFPRIPVFFWIFLKRLLYRWLAILLMEFLGKVLKEKGKLLAYLASN